MKGRENFNLALKVRLKYLPTSRNYQGNFPIFASPLLIPEYLIAFGSATVGALTSLLAPSPMIEVKGSGQRGAIHSPFIDPKWVDRDVRKGKIR